MESGWKPENFIRESPQGGLDQVTGQSAWKNLFYGCMAGQTLAEWMRLPQTWFFLLSGESGTGKRFLARAFAAEMCKTGYHFLELDGSSLTAASEEETCERIEKLCRKLAGGESWFVLLKGADRLAGAGAAAFLAEEMERLRDKNAPVIIAATAEEQQKVAGALCRIFYLCRMELPKEKDRLDFFSSYWSGSFLQREAQGGVNAQQMAQITEGMNYQQLEMLRRMMDGAVIRSYFRKAEKSAGAGTVEERLMREAESGAVVLPISNFENSAKAIRRGYDTGKKDGTGANAAARDSADGLYSLLQLLQSASAAPRGAEPAPQKREPKPEKEEGFKRLTEADELPADLEELKRQFGRK